MESASKLEGIARLVRSLIVKMGAEAGSGHTSSSLSATDLIVCLLYGGAFRFDPDDPAHPNNDRLIFSKGHASQLLYSAWAPAGKVTEAELLTFRKFGSPFEGHPTTAFRYAEAPTGSLGQGLPIGVGMALNARYLDSLPYRVYVLLGDSEMSEGSQWEAMQIAAHYRLDNLVGIIDVNRLGQRGETMYGHDIEAYARRVSSFGWETIAVDGHSVPQVLAAYEDAARAGGRPAMIIAKTLKGKGVSAIEDKNGWHGKPVGKAELKQALDDIGEVDVALRAEIEKPEDLRPVHALPETVGEPEYPDGKPASTRRAYGNALRRIYPAHPDMVVLDAEVSNSTYSEVFRDAYPGRFFEMYLAEQNMVSAALGLERRGKVPFVSTFAAFLTRAFDQVRMAHYAQANIKFSGSHAGVSIGEDGPSQMGLEDLAMFRSLQNCAVLYPSDAVSAERLVEAAAAHKGMVYIRTTRGDMPIIYDTRDKFRIGGSKVVRRSANDVFTVVAAGATLHEALKAYQELRDDGIEVRVIDLYSIKPVDHIAINEAARQTKALITVEDHVPEGGLGEAVRSALDQPTVPVFSLAVRRTPKSGRPSQLLDYEEICADAIAREIRELL